MATDKQKPLMATDKLKGRKTLKVNGFLQEFEKDEVKRKIDIVSLFAFFGVKLEKKGKSHTGLCPFHDDTNPSLSVDGEKGLYNCFGCGESGDAFTLVEKTKGITFREALEFLKEWSGNGKMVEPEKIHSFPIVEAKPEIVEPVVQMVEGSATISLPDVIDYYHKQIYQANDALEYLKKRGITNPELIKRFGIGFADGSLLSKLSEIQREHLKAEGVIRDNGAEHFYGCITFPLYDRDGNPVGLYGRSISSPQHLYLKGKHKGLFNPKAFSVFSELILTESVIDALSLIHLGIDNVVPCYGTNGFTEDHLKALKDSRVKTIVIGFDNDEAGKKASDKLLTQLVSENYEVKTIFPSEKDWNESLSKGTDASFVRNLIEVATPMKQEQAEQPFSVSKEGNRYSFIISEIAYRLLGAKEMFVANLRVNVRAEMAEMLYIDNVDLYSARSRATFSLNLSKQFEVEAKRVENDLIRIVEYLENERDRKLSEYGKNSPAVEMSEEDRKLGLSLLQSPDLFEQIVSDMETLGYVGEEENKQLVYLTAVSRLLEKPLSVYIQSGASSGKSYLIETLRKMLPKEVVRAVSSFSNQSLNYMAEEDFIEKVMMLGEAIHNEEVEGQIRQIQSENEISRLVALKDAKTGELISREVRHKVRIAFMMSSTALYLNPENASRCLLLHTDETAEQTERVLKAQRERRTIEEYAKNQHQIPVIIRKHHCAQRLLKKLSVFNPFAPLLKFPKNRPTMRRSQEQFLSIIETICLLRQVRKEIVVKDVGGVKIEGILCDMEDYRIAYYLFANGVLLPNAGELPTGAKILYEKIRAMVRKIAKKEGIEPTQVSFIQKDLRDLSELGADSVRKYVQVLVDYEYLEVSSGRMRGTRHIYKLREDKPIEDMDLSVIPTPDFIKSEESKEK